jgi:hypothetical protein
MKNLILCLILVSMFGCSKEDLSRRPATQQPSSKDMVSKSNNPMVSFIGLWKMKKGNYTNVLLFKDEKDYKTQELETKVYGLDFYPDFNYRSVATSDIDNPKIEFNPDRNRIEGLVLAEINKDSVLLESYFEFLSPDTLKVTLRVNDKEVTQVYERSKDMRATALEYDELQRQRTNEVLEKGLSNLSCDFIRWGIEARDTRATCLRSKAKNGELDAKLMSQYLRSAIESDDIESVKLLLSLGVNVNAPMYTSNGYKTAPLTIITKASRGAFGIKDHGMVSYGFNKFKITKLLIEAGADLTVPSGVGGRSTAFQTFLNWSDDEIVRLALKKGARFEKPYVEDEAPFIGFFYNYDSRTGKQEGVSLIKDLIKAGANINDVYGDLSGSVASIAAARADVDALRFLKSQGIDFNRWPSGLSSAQKELADTENYVRSEKLSEWDLMFFRKKVQRLKENISYLESIK